MKTRILVFLLLASLLLGALTPFAAFAEDDAPLGASKGEIEAAQKIIKDAIKGLSDLFPDEKDADSVAEIFDTATAAIKTGMSILSAVSGGITFLRLIGVMEDPTKRALINIQNQLHAISDKLVEMDAKLDALTDAMAKFEAKNEYGKRIDAARSYRLAFRDFRRDYMEKTMDQHMTEFDSMRIDAMKSWCRNVDADARSKDGVVNTRVTLLYETGEAGEKLRLTAANGVPKDFDGKILVLSEDFLPQSLDWNVNTYREQIIEYITGKINEALESGNFDAFESVNFPEFAAGGAPSKELIDLVANDAFDTILYRALAAELNRSSVFVKQLIKDFTDYCTHIAEYETGVDAMIEAMYLTHSFESEIADTITNFVDSMILKTACYSVFVSDVIGMSDAVEESVAKDFVDVGVAAFANLDKAKSNALTGNGNYCYLTNSLLYYGDVYLTSSAQIKTSRDGSVDGLEGYSASAMTPYFHAPGVQSGKLGRGNLIGDATMQLLDYTLRSNGHRPDHAFFNKTLAGGGAEDLGMLATSVGNEISLATSDNSVVLRSKDVIGSYFPNGNKYTLGNLPSSAKAEYIVHHTKVNGSIYDPASGSVRSSQPLFAMALYAEGHWYWYHDEAAFFGGAVNDREFYGSYEKICTQNSGPQLYDNNYKLSAGYNALYSVAYTGHPLQGTGLNPLSSFVSLCGEIEEEFPRPAPETGDNTAIIAVWSVAALLGAAVCTKVAVRRRKRKGAV